MKKVQLIIEDSERAGIEKAIEDFKLEEYLLLESNESFDKDFAGVSIFVNEDKIGVSNDWLNIGFPFLFNKEIKFSRENLFAMIFYQMNLFEDAVRISPDQGLLNQIHFILGSEIPSLDIYEIFEGHSLYHNAAIESLYGKTEHPDKLSEMFENAMSKAESKSDHAFTAYHYSMLLQDLGRFEEAISILQPFLESSKLSQFTKKVLHFEIIRCYLNISETAEVESELLALVSYFESKGLTHLSGQVYQELSDYYQKIETSDKSLDAINNAIILFENSGLNEFSAQAKLSKAALLHTVAKSGKVQYYSEAIKLYQDIVGVFDKHQFPYQFADIQSRLGVLYAEMPDTTKKKSIWAAVSASSFNEALSFFDKTNFPYEYGMICHNYGTAMMNYPAAMKTDNIEKAIHYFNEALSVRSKHFPVERCHTLLNYLEACWEVGNVNDLIEDIRTKDMLEKINEILKLSEDHSVRERALEHRDKLMEIAKIDV